VILLVTVNSGIGIRLGSGRYDAVADFEGEQLQRAREGAKLSPSDLNIAGLGVAIATGPDYTAENAQEMKGVLLGVLDHGYVGLIDSMGDDSRIVQAARVSYGKGTHKAREDRGLIRYLMRHDHTTPFEMVEIAFIVKMPIFVARQWIRHRTANVNEYSMRYSEATDEFYIPNPDVILGQSSRNRQGSEGDLPPGARAAFIEDVIKTSKEAYGRYQKALEAGVARETARILLPVNTYTKWHWKIDLHNLFHFLGLRLDAHAQWEIRQYATPMFELAKLVAPTACEAFEDFALEGARLSNKEQTALAHVLNGESFEKACESAGIELMKEGKPMKTGEGVEWREKLAKMRRRVEALDRSQPSAV